MNLTENNKTNFAPQIIGLTMLLAICFAVIRYHLMGSVPWKDFPFFILNKGISLAAIILLILNFVIGPLKNLGIKMPAGWLNSRRALGMTGFLLVLLHVIMSLILFNPTIYTKFFETDGTLTFTTGISMLGGVLGFVILWAYNLSFQTHMREDQAFIKFITSRGFMLVAMLFTAIHLVFMGFSGWLEPSSWNGGIPPISLVAFIFFSVAYLINLVGRK
jgi:DMSO/TMAO reductase YedYZ heme-binding membrane subunit